MSFKNYGKGLSLVNDPTFFPFRYSEFKRASFCSANINRRKLLLGSSIKLRKLPTIGDWHFSLKNL